MPKSSNYPVPFIELDKQVQLARGVGCQDRGSRGESNDWTEVWRGLLGCYNVLFLDLNAGDTCIRWLSLIVPLLLLLRARRALSRERGNGA